MIFRKQKPEVTGEYFVLLKGASEPRIAWFDRGYGTFTTWTSGSITRRVAYWGDRIETPSVEIEEDESSATSSEPGDIAPLMGLLNNSSDEELDCLEQYFERQRES